MSDDFMTKISNILDDDAPIESFNLIVYCNRADVARVQSEFNSIPVTIVPELWRHSWIVRHILNYLGGNKL